MAPLRGWAPKGQRLHAKVRYGHWRTMTFIAALRHDRIDAPCVFDQPINAETFIAWVEHQLCPTLSPGDIVVLDNLSSHKSPVVRAAIRSTGARLPFLPLPAFAGAGSTAPASTRSNRCSPSSNTSGAKQPNAHTKPPGGA
jgi:hypothetical protein